MDPTQDNKATPTPVWLSVVVLILGILEKVLPAFFVAWNNAIRQKNAELTAKLKLAEVEKQVEKDHAQIVADHEGKSDRDIVDDFLSK